MKIYLAGPMTGIPEFNFPLFNQRARDLRQKGHEVFNPAETDGGDTSKSWEYYMRKDIIMVAGSDAVALLPGWQKSRGALFEILVAQTLGIPVLDAESLKPAEESVLHEADRLVSGDRAKDYGHPFHDFTRTGKMWGAILGTPEVPPELVGLCMIAVKLSREVNQPKRDNRVDGPGYFKCVDMIHEYRKSHKDVQQP